MSKKINIGILGCANIAQRFIIPALKEMNEFNIMGVASRSKEKADRFSEEFEVKAFYNYQSLVEYKNLDVVYIPLPNSLHYEWIKKSLQQGLNVLVEKSMTCNYKEVVELNDIAKKNGLVLMENFQFRFHSQLEYLKKIIKKGVIGELRTIRSSFGFPPFSDKDNIRYDKNLGGGALLDAGAYPLKISQIFMGNNIYVDSSSIHMDKNKEIDIYGSVQIKDRKSKIVSQCSFGFDNFYQCNIEFWGSKGKIYTNRIFTAPPEYSPVIELETDIGKEVIILEVDNHFKKILKYLHTQILTKKNLDDEYEQNITQARLIREVNS
jgi:dTDP-3,4-didehydro-2,6-dideoxy-alpha-D-glucose 3-reductase